MKKKTKAQRIAEIPLDKIMKLSGPVGKKKLEGYVRDLRYGYNRRVASFKKKGLVSHAQISLENSMPSKPKVQLTKLSRNQLLLEFVRYSKFFTDETSTEEGIRRVNREQDVRIFGASSSGRPNRTMTTDERTLFWSLYDEYKNQEPTGVNRYGSEFAQQTLGEIMFQDGGITSDNFMLALNKMRENLEKKTQEENIRSVPNVYSGRGFTF